MIIFIAFMFSLVLAWVIADAVAGMVEPEPGEWVHWHNGQYAKCEDRECVCNMEGRS